jgi:hypothetical protein
MMTPKLSRMAAALVAMLGIGAQAQQGPAAPEMTSS